MPAGAPIKPFAHKGLEQFFTIGSAAGIQPRRAKRLRLILAQSIRDMDVPDLHLHELKANERAYGP